MEWSGAVFYLLEGLFVLVAPCVTLYIGYRMGWSDAKGRPFRHHTNKYWY